MKNETGIKPPPILGPEITRFKRYIKFAIIFWSLAVLLFLFWNLLEKRREVIEVLRIQANVVFEKDILYRQWCTMHGGVYAPVTDTTSPNPYLNVVDRVIETPSGMKLTLINPAYMTRQVHELQAKESGVLGHITSLNPIRPENAADSWETDALRSFEHGETEQTTIMDIKDNAYFRLIRPLRTEQHCLKCHAKQGYQVGDIRGGISVSVPTATVLSIEQKHAVVETLGHFFLWLIGFFFIGVGGNSTLKGITARIQAEEKAAHFGHILESSLNEIYMFDSETLRFIQVNRGARDNLGYSIDELNDLTPVDLKPEFTSESFAELVEPLKVGQKEALHFNTFHKRQDGSLYPVEVHLQLSKHESLAVFVALTLDITERRKAEKALQEREIQYRTLFENSTESIMILDSSGVFVSVNPATLEMFSLEKEENLFEKTPAIVSPEFQPDGTRSSEKVLLMINKAYENGINDFEWVHKRSNGQIFPAYVRLAPLQLDERKMVQVAARDISKQKKLEDKLKHLSSIDPLTGIANRRIFNEVLAQEHDRHVRSDGKLSLILLDIDYFKKFNDCYGHVEGDKCLQQVAQTLADCLDRPADLAARYGGEEFACILPETDRVGAVAVAEKIRKSIVDCDIPHKESGVAACVTASLGVVTVQCSAEKIAKDVVVQADELLYRAKASGRNRVEAVAPEDIGEEVKGDLLRLVWKDYYCCGNRLIDSQHRAIFAMSNRLFEAILSEYPAVDVAAIITQLLDDVRQHFQDEEKLLETVGYPDLKQHAEKHASLLGKGIELSQMFNESKITTGGVFQFLVSEGVMNHMLKADRKFFRFIKEANANY
ncbi:MAG: diguanylate cyclase [Desulfobacterales bacterium]|nr:diguanylate cyclase [Desulfobacterales bacterium]